MTTALKSLIAGAATLAALSLVAAPAEAQNTRSPHVVVELFESQGCSSCPPANANVNALSDRQDLLTLIYGVTYWDQLGWRDTFARPEFTQRQRDYARGLGNSNVYTPQVVLNGRADIVGADRTALGAAIGVAARQPLSVSINLAMDSVTIPAQRGPRGGADVWLVRYDPRTLNVPIRAGENNGRTLPHVHVVRSIERLGQWSGAAHVFHLAQTDQSLRTAVLVQAHGGGAILGAATDG